MKQTFLLAKVTHDKPLPDDVLKILQDRIYAFLYSRGVEAGVVVTVEKPLEVRGQ